MSAPPPPPSRRCSLVAALKHRGSRSLLTRRSTEHCSSFESTGSCSSTEGEPPTKRGYRLLLLGASQVGKTALVSQFLYDSFICGYKETMDEMYHGDFLVGGAHLSLDIQDTGGNYVDEFPAMLSCSLASADAVLLVYSVSSLESFEEVSRLRDLVQSQRGPELPLVVVGNKTDLARQVPQEEAEATVLCDWENGYIECCAKDNTNIENVFRTLLIQAKSGLNLISTNGLPEVSFKRRQSLPQVPAFSRLQGVQTSASPGVKRRASMGLRRVNSCKQQ